MIPWRIVALALLGIGGCAAVATPSRSLTSLPEVMCKHCNCLMPAGLDPDAKCPACDCGKRAHQCVRGR